MGGIVKGIGDAVGGVSKEFGKSVGSAAPKELTTLGPTVAKAMGDTKGLSKALEELTKQGNSAMKSAKSIGDAIEDALVSIEKSDFGLDPKDPAQKKALEAARKLVTTKLKSMSADIERGVASFEKTAPALAKAGKSAVA